MDVKASTLTGSLSLKKQWRKAYAQTKKEGMPQVRNKFEDNCKNIYLDSDSKGRV